MKIYFKIPREKTMKVKNDNNRNNNLLQFFVFKLPDIFLVEYSMITFCKKTSTIPDFYAVKIYLSYMLLLI